MHGWSYSMIEIDHADGIGIGIHCKTLSYGWIWWYEWY
jgi:hypothetical protein